MSLVTDLFGRLRKEIQLVAKAIAGMDKKKVRWPANLHRWGLHPPFFRWAPYSVRTFLVGFSA